MTKESILGQYDPNTVPNADCIEGYEVKAIEVRGEVYLYAEGYGQILGIGRLRRVGSDNFSADFRLQNDSGEDFQVLKGNIKSITSLANTVVSRGYYWVVR